MAKLIVSEFMTLDGVMEAPGGEPGHPHSGWVIDFMSDEQLAYKLAETKQAESLLIGRVTYESFAGAWPQRTGEFAHKMNTMPKHVISSTLRDPEWTNTTVLRGDVPARIRELKQLARGPILVAGSRTLVPTLLEHDLVDELRVMLFPVLVGGGRRLFPEGWRKKSFRLTETRPFASGVTVLTYTPQR